MQATAPANFNAKDSDKILVTGAAGFIGFHLTRRLLEQGEYVWGIDNINDYYDTGLKLARLDILRSYDRFSFERLDLTDQGGLQRCFTRTSFDYVVNLAAQAGVRYSITNPRSYLESNISGFLNILEECRRCKVKHLVYASSSSVYGANGTQPFSTHVSTEHPVSLYAASKKSNEMMAHVYSTLFKIPTTGLRFFSVYGPYGRPDMALFKFTKAILEGATIDVYNNGNMKRDFTYVDDVVEGITRLIRRVATPNEKWDANAPDPATSFAPYRLYNIGSDAPVRLMKFIDLLERRLGKTARKNMLPIQDGDVAESWANVDDLRSEVGFKPATSIEEGVNRFVDWYLDHYKTKR